MPACAEGDARSLPYISRQEGKGLPACRLTEDAQHRAQLQNPASNSMRGEKMRISSADIDEDMGRNAFRYFGEQKIRSQKCPNHGRRTCNAPVKSNAAVTTALHPVACSISLSNI